jgi:hypothetical protein
VNNQSGSSGWLWALIAERLGAHVTGYGSG